jgi:hypothetical protein
VSFKKCYLLTVTKASIALCPSPVIINFFTCFYDGVSPIWQYSQALLCQSGRHQPSDDFICFIAYICYLAQLGSFLKHVNLLRKEFEGGMFSANS